MDTIEFQGHQIRKWTVGASTFLAYPEAGARLMNWHLQMADGSYRDVIHWPEDADLNNIAKVRGGNPVLFPFAARTFCDGEIEYWKHDGQKLPMKTHGYARQGRFAIESIFDKGFLAKFIPSDECREAYPFDYEFSVRYRFEELAFYVDYELKNLGSKPLPWAAGHHFYFSLPWHDDLSRRDYIVTTSAKKAFRQSDSGKLEPVKDFPDPADFGNPDINDLIRAKLKTGEVRFGPRGGEEDIVIKIGDGTRPSQWTTVVTWTMEDDSPFYCVEPWMAPPNAWENNSGLHHVDPGKSEVFTVKVALG
ncbi:MAG: aldose 1-epimerase [Puniceicoccales bacterium]